MQRTISKLLVAALLLPATDALAQAPAKWTPTKPIQILVGFAPGGSADMIARFIAQASAPIIPVPVVVVNRPGASGAIAAQATADAPPDGYTLFVGGGSETTSVGNHQKIPYDSRTSFRPVIKIARLPLMVAVRADSKYRSFADLLAAARAKAGAVSYGSTGEGSLAHSTMIVLEKKTGTQFLHVPYKGAAQSMLALVAGEVDMSIGAPEEVKGHVDGGKLRIIATASGSRVPGFEAVPTLKELGHDLVLDNMKGLMAPAGLPDPVYEYLHEAFRRALESAAWKEQSGRAGLLTDYKDGPGFQKDIVDGFNLIGSAIRK